MRPKEKMRNHKRPKVVFATVTAIAFVVLLAVVGMVFFKTPKVIRESEINIGSDLRDNALEVSLTRNDSTVAITNESKSGQFFAFASIDGNYRLKISFQARELALKKFVISDNEPKFVYVWFDEKSSQFQHYFDEVYRKKMVEKSGGITLSKIELRALAVEVKQSISIKDLEKIGYDLSAEKVEVLVRESPFPKL